MPKTITREYDNTKPVTGAYANFSVVVPGLVLNTEAFGLVADENGVYEVSSQKDFELNVGLVDVKDAYLVTPAVAAERDGDIINFEAEDAIEDNPETQDIDETKAAKPIEDVFAEFCAALEDDEQLYLAKQNDNPRDIGELRDSDYIYVSAKNDEGEYVWDSEHWSTETDFAVIKDAKKGADEARCDQYGNLIAYELLGLGYTVLYKKIESAPEHSADILDYNKFWACLTDKDLYDFRYIVSGFLTDIGPIAANMIKLAHAYNTLPTDNGRGDCTALIDVDKTTYEGKSQAEAIKSIQKWLGSCPSSKYAGYFAPWVNYDLPVTNGKYKGCYTDQTFPCSFHYLACAAKAAENYSEWYAIAGYTRGISKYKIKGIGCRFGAEAVDAFEPRWLTWNSAQQTGMNFALNIIKTVKNNYYLWGNRTAEMLLSKEDGGDLMASHFLNIRQLCTTIKKHARQVCDSMTFDPNSDILWEGFCARIRPLLEKMKADQGLDDYKIIRVKSNRKATVTAKIRIVPIEAVEDFYIDIYLENSVAGVTATVEEE